jgi:hypothetical protein
MPKILNPSTPMAVTNYKIKDVDLNQIFEPRFIQGVNIGNYKINNNNLIFNDILSKMFEVTTAMVTAKDNTNTQINITLNGEYLTYIKHYVLLINNIKIYNESVNFTNNSSNILTKNYSMTGSTRYNYSLYLFDSNKQFYDTNLFDSSFVSFPSLTLSLSSTSTNIIATVGGTSSSNIYYFANTSNVSTGSYELINNELNNHLFQSLTPNTLYYIFIKLTNTPTVDISGSIYTYPTGRITRIVVGTGSNEGELSVITLAVTVTGNYNTVIYDLTISGSYNYTISNNIYRIIVPDGYDIDDTMFYVIVKFRGPSGLQTEDIVYNIYGYTNTYNY